MRALLVSTSVVALGGNYGGIEKMAYDLAGGLHQAGNVVTVAAPYGSQMPYEQIHHIPTVKLPYEQDRDDIAVNQGVYGRGHGFGPYDIILDFSHGHFLGRDPAINRHLPLLNMVWDNITIRYQKALYNIGCVSDWQRDRFKSLYGQDAKTVPKWGYVDGARYRPAKNPKRERFLFLGKLTPDKGALQAIELAKQSGAPLDVVGGLLATDPRPYADSLRSMADGERIRFYFNVDEAHKIQLIQNAKAVIYPVQFDEAHNLVAIECATTKTPFIQYRRGAIGAESHLQEELGAKAVDSPENFAEAMKTVDSWFEPTTTDWSIQGRLQTYLAFFKEIQEGLRWG